MRFPFLPITRQYLSAPAAQMTTPSAPVRMAGTEVELQQPLARSHFPIIKMYFVLKM